MSDPPVTLRRIVVETLLCFVVLSALFSIVFGQAVFEIAAGGTPGMFDIKHYFVPMSFELDSALQSGEVPQWNPLTFCGAPFAANPQSATFYPPQAIRSLFTPGPTPLNTYYSLMLLLALQTIVAGVGVYWLARSHGLGYTAALAAAATFIFSVAFTRRVAEFHFIPALMWMPFVLIAFRKLLREPQPARRFFWAAGCGMMIGWSFLSGFVQIEVYVALVFLAYYLLDRIFLTQYRNDHVNIPKMLSADLFYGACIALIACATAAVLLVPGAEFAQLTYRSGTGQARIVDYSVDWSGIRAGLFGAENESPYRTAALSAYVLGIVGLFGKRRREAVVYGLMFLGLLDCSLGPPFPIASLVNLISPFQIAHPNRALVLACLPLGLAVGLGVQALNDGHETTRARVRSSIVIAAACLCVLLLAALPALDTVTMLVLGLGVVAVSTVWLPVGRIAVPVVCGLLLAETIVSNHRYLPAMLDQSGAIDVRASSSESTGLWDDNSRVCDLAPNQHLYALEPAINGYDPLYLGPVWKLLAPWYYNWNYQRILQAHDTVRDNPYPYLFVKRSFWLARQYVEGPLPEGDPLFPPTTTAFVQSETALTLPRVTAESVIDQGVSSDDARPLGKPRSVESMPLGAGPQSPTWELELPDLARQHAVLRIACHAPCEGTIRILGKVTASADRLPVYFATIDEDKLGAFDLDIPLPDITLTSVRIVWDAKSDDCPMDLGEATLLVDGDDEDRLIRIVKRTFNTVRVDVDELSGPRILTFIDADFPGWTVQVDGEPHALLKVNSAFKGVELGEGKHTVEFRFRSKSLERGMAISGISVGAILIGLLSAVVRRRNGY